MPEDPTRGKTHPMSRDMLALRCLELLMQHRSWDHVGSSDEIMENMVTGAYTLADMLLEARKKKHA